MKRSWSDGSELRLVKAKNMAIKINLLPQSYALEKTRNRWIAGMASLLGLTALSIGLLHASDKKQLEKIQADTEAVRVVAAQTTAATAAKDAADAAKGSIKAVVDFMADASKSGSERAAFVDLMRRFIYNRAVVSNLDVSNGTDAKITATVRSPDEYARFLLALRQGTKGVTAEGGNATEAGKGKVFDSPPVASGVRGYPNGRRVEPPPNISDFPTPILFPIQVDAQGPLKTDASARNGLLYVPVEPPGTVVSGGGAAGGAGGAGGGSLSGAGAPSPAGSPAPAASPASGGRN